MNGLIFNHFNPSFKQGLITHDSHAPIKLELTRLGLCVHVHTTSHSPVDTAMSLSIVVSHLESMDPGLHRTCPMVLSHVRRCRSCIPLYNAIASQGDDRQTSVEVASRRPDAKIVIRNVGPPSKIHICQIVTWVIRRLRISLMQWPNMASSHTV
jgi:hypothetical protein